MSDLIEKSVLMEKMHKYGFTAPDMTVHEFIEDELPSVASTRWVRCEERLPEVYQHVFVSRGNAVEILMRSPMGADGGVKYWENSPYSRWESIEDDDYWMPIEPPKEVMRNGEV